MSLALNLTSVQMLTFMRLAFSHHIKTTHVQLLDLNHNYLDDLSDRLKDGQVSVDLDADVTRSCNVSLADPARTIQLDNDSPDKGAMFINRMIRISQTISSPDRAASFTVPVFCGPLRKFNRNLAEVTLEAQGKEALLLAPLWTPKVYKAGTSRYAIIYDLLVSGGERPASIGFPSSGGGNIAKDYVIGTDRSRWVAARDLAGSMRMQLFYDARGIAQMKTWTNRPVSFLFEEKHLVTRPLFGYDLANVVNAVQVTGGKPAGRTQPVVARVVAPPGHPLSATSLGRNNKPAYYPMFVTDDKIRTQAAVNAEAAARLNEALLEAMDVSFDAVPNLLLEPGDECAIKTSEYYTVFRLRKFTIPFRASGVSSIGYLKQVSLGMKAPLSSVRSATRAEPKKKPAKKTTTRRRARKRTPRRRRRR